MQNLREIIISKHPRKVLLRLALPMMFGNAIQNVFLLTDMYFVGKLGTTSLAAIGIAGIVTSGTMSFIIGLAVATRAMVSRYMGANDYEMAHKSAVGSIFTGVLVSVVIALCGIIFSRILLILMGAEGELLDLSSAYLIIMLIGSFSMVYMFVIRAIYQGAGDTITPTIIVVGSVILNIALDRILIFGLGPIPAYGVRGAAYATVTARLLGALTGFLILLKGSRAFKLHIAHFSTTLSVLKRFLHIGLPSTAQHIVQISMGFIMMRLIASYGVFATAAYTIGIRMNLIALLPGFALGGATAAAVGQNLGAEKPKRAMQTVFEGIRIFELFFLPFALVYILFGEKIAMLFTSDLITIYYTTSYLSIVPLVYPILAIGIIAIGGINGSGHTIIPFFSHLVALYLIQLPVAFFVSQIIGPSGIFLGIAAGMIGQTLTILPYFLSKKWLTTGR
jgi:putative MATE family efflux protein